MFLIIEKVLIINCKQYAASSVPTKHSMTVLFGNKNYPWPMTTKHYRKSIQFNELHVPCLRQIQ